MSPLLTSPHLAEVVPMEDDRSILLFCDSAQGGRSPSLNVHENLLDFSPFLSLNIKFRLQQRFSEMAKTMSYVFKNRFQE